MFDLLLLLLCGQVDIDSAEQAKSSFLCAIENDCFWHPVMQQILRGSPRLWHKRWHRSLRWDYVMPNGQWILQRPTKEVRRIEALAHSYGVMI